MKKKAIVAVAVLAVVAVIVLLVQRVAQAHEAPAFRFTQIERGDMQSSVSATGTLNAVTTISVGTQVSGQVAELLVDYNDHVRKGQLLARIDPTLAQQAVADAQANVAKAEAERLQARRDYSRNRELASAGLVARSEVEQTQSSDLVANANVQSAQIALQRAKQNLAYTNIYAPIDGVVIERNVQKGQTVAASLSAPQLFLIANDLSQMQILAQVGESDIAQIQQGQPVDFTVQALTGQTFHGTVQQVRLQSATTDNVVNYTVVVAVDNKGGKLLPGMTARVNFVTKSAANVLEVANSALRFRPTDEQLAAYKAQSAKTSTTSTAAQQASSASQPRGPRTRSASGTRSGFGTLWYLDANDKLQMARVKVGITDGTTTQIEGKTIAEGMKVIAGAATATQTAQTSSNAAPFGGSAQQRPAAGRPGAGF